MPKEQVISSEAKMKIHQDREERGKDVDAIRDGAMPGSLPRYRTRDGKSILIVTAVQPKEVKSTTNNS